MYKFKHAYALTLALLGCTLYAVPVKADHLTMNKGSDRDRLQLNFVKEPPLPSSGTPIGRRRGAAGRSGGNCTVNLPLTALVPAIETPLGAGKATYVWGKTIAPHPTFWFYVPDSSPSVRSVEFVLQDEQDNDVYRTPVSIPHQPGVISVKLPATSTALNVNQNYHWFLKTEIALSCDRQQPVIAKDTVEGWVQRIQPNPTLTNQIEAATPQKQIRLYARNGLWYDTLTTLAELRLVKPEDGSLKGDWHELLHSVGLDEIASQSLVQCCTANSELGDKGTSGQGGTIQNLKSKI